MTGRFILRVVCYFCEWFAIVAVLFSGGRERKVISWGLVTRLVVRSSTLSSAHLMLGSHCVGLGRSFCVAWLVPSGFDLFVFVCVLVSRLNLPRVFQYHAALRGMNFESGSRCPQVEI